MRLIEKCKRAQQVNGSQPLFHIYHYSARSNLLANTGHPLLNPSSEWDHPGRPACHRPGVVVVVDANLKITIFIVSAHLPTVCHIKPTGQYWPSSPQSLQWVRPPWPSSWPPTLGCSNSTLKLEDHNLYCTSTFTNSLSNQSYWLHP